MPEGYVIDEEATPEEITVTDGAIQVVVKAVTQDITVYYYDEEAGESAGDAVAKLVVRNDKVSRADVPVPEGYVIDEEATPEEITVTDGAIQVVVKAATEEIAQDITVYYYNEEAGESAGDAVVKLVVRNDKVSRADVPVPEGYVIDEEATRRRLQ